MAKIKDNKLLSIKFIFLIIQSLTLFSVGDSFAKTKPDSFVINTNEIGLPLSSRRQTVTWLPWVVNTRTYEGYFLENIVNAYSLTPPKKVTLSASDGYKFTIDYMILVKNAANVIDTVDGEKLPASLGPYWLIMNQSRYPIVGNRYLRRAMVWQLTKITLHY